MTSNSKQFAVGIAAGGLLTLLGVALIAPRRADADLAPKSSDTNAVSVSDAGKRIADIETVAVSQVAGDHVLKLSGVVAYSPDRTVKIAPRLTGRVRAVFVKVGDRVSAGQTLATLDSVDAATARNTTLECDNKLRLAKSTLEVANEQLKLGTPEVTSSEAVYKQAVESERSAKYLLDRTLLQSKLGGFAQKPLEDATNALITAQASLTQANADLEVAKKDLARKKKLVEIGVAATADLEVSQDTFDKATATASAARDALALAQQAQRRETKAYETHLYSDQQVEAQRTAYNQASLQRVAAKRALDISRAALLQDVRNARSAFELARFDSVNAHRALELLGSPSASGAVDIKSPIAGVVTERDVNPGQVVDQSQMAPWQMLVISDPSAVVVDSDLFEKDVASVEVGSAVEIRVGALPGKRFRGTVQRIAPTIDKTARSLKLRSEIPNPTGLLRDGEFAEVEVQMPSARPLLRIPLSAVLHDGDKDYVYVQAKHGYEKCGVEVGSIDGDQVAVNSGLTAGQIIVKHGALFLGSEVNGN